MFPWRAQAALMDRFMALSTQLIPSSKGPPKWAISLQARYHHKRVFPGGRKTVNDWWKINSGVYNTQHLAQELASCQMHNRRLTTTIVFEAVSVQQNLSLTLMLVHPRARPPVRLLSCVGYQSSRRKWLSLSYNIARKLQAQ